MRRFRGSQEAELFGPRGALPRRGEPDASRDTARAILAGLILVSLALRLAVPRGIGLDEAITIHQAHLSIHDLFHNLYYGDRQPPLYHLTLWLTVHAFGDGELAVRLPSLIAGTLLVPVLYELGRELYDRRTGLIAAGFASVSPALVWYAQEARMYEFAALFGLLAVLTQARAIRNGTLLNWAAYILATSALLWSHYFGLLLIGVQQLVFVAAIVQRRRSAEPVRPLVLGFVYSAAMLAFQLVPLLLFAHHQYVSTTGPAGSPNGTYELLSFHSVVTNLASSIWGYQPGAVSPYLGALWPLLLLVSLALVGRASKGQTKALAFGAVLLLVLVLVVSAFDRPFFELRNFLFLVPLVLLLIARMIANWTRSPRATLLVAGGFAVTLVAGLADQQLNKSNPSLFDFRGAIHTVTAKGGPNSLVLYEPGDMRYVLQYYAPRLRSQPLTARITTGGGSPVFVLASFQRNKTFSSETKKVVGQLTAHSRLIGRFRRPQTVLWEFR